ncbi:MAG: ATP-binding protein [Actinomycetota bacterium]|nr:ATP-binding protein [Actinomycetota bacterium]
MAEKELTRSAQTVSAARSAGVKREKLTLADVDKRRTQLWSLSLGLVVATTVAIGVIYLGGDLLPDQLRVFEHLGAWIVAILFAGLALAFLVYVIEQERNLRRVAMLLVEERVLTAALSNRLAEISALSEVGKAINTTLDLQDILRMILSSALELLGGTEGSLMLLDDTRTHLEVVSYSGTVPEPVAAGRTAIGEGIAGTVAARREPMLINSDQVEPGLEAHAHPERGIQSSVCVPLMRGEELLGILNLNETEGDRIFTQQDLEALELFAEHAAIAIANAALLEQERETVQRLEELDRLKSDFIATVSHELRTPLTAIIGSATTLSKRSSRMSPEQRTTLIEMIERQGQRLLRLVQDILTTAHIESGMPKLRRELVDLRSAAEVIISDLQHAHPSREVALTTDPDTPHAWGDLGALQQILSNLIENALKYSDEGKVEVFLTENQAETRIAVRDRGRGISREQLDTIFDRFRQVDQSNTRGKGGFGLGLYIVKSLVDAHNGEIKVDSAEGAGTTFTVHLPKRARDQEQPLLSTSPHATAPQPDAL